MATSRLTSEEVYLKSLFVDIQKLMEQHCRGTIEFVHYRTLIQQKKMMATQPPPRLVQQPVLQERKPQAMMLSPSPPDTVSPQLPADGLKPSVEVDQNGGHPPPQMETKLDDQFPSFYKQSSDQQQQPCPQFVSRPVTRPLPAHIGQQQQQYSSGYPHMYSPNNLPVGRVANASSSFSPSPLDQPFAPQQLPMIMRNIQRNPEMIPHTYGQPGLSESKVSSMMSHPAAYRQLQQQPQQPFYRGQQPSPSPLAELPFNGMVDWALYLKDLPPSEKKDDFWHIDTEGVDATLDELISMMETPPLPKNFVFPPMGQAQMMQAPGII